MINIADIKYRVIVVASDGTQYDIQDYLEELGWEENENEISMRTSFSCKNEKTSIGRLQKLMSLGTLVVVLAVCGSKKDEVARGYVTDWNPVLQNESDQFKASAYDELFNLQNSQDDRYFKKGTKTKSNIKKIFKAWKITLGKYNGPNVRHGKKIYSREYLSDMILDLLDDGAKKGEGKAVLRASGGKVSVLSYGSNETVYVFNKDNIISVSYSKSTADMITRVKVRSRVDDNGKSKVQATVKGLTKYGIRQRIYTRESDESLKDAKKAAKEILNEKGSVEKGITVKVPNVPYIRKGDVVYVENAKIPTGFYFVIGIRHDVDTCTMSMDLELSEKQVVENNEVKSQKTYKVDDVVDFKGGKHFVSYKKGSKGSAVTKGKAKIKKIKEGKAHPYYLVHTNNKSEVNGWVNKDTFS